MRDIKFRGLTNSGIWVYGLPIEYEYGVAITNKDSLYQVDCSEWNFGGKDIIPDTLGQYTRLKDQSNYYGMCEKEDAEIWEGDILGSKDKKQKFIVLFEDGGFVAKRADGLMYEDLFTTLNCGEYNDLEVIGNIYENKEILEKQ